MKTSRGTGNWSALSRILACVGFLFPLAAQQQQPAPPAQPAAPTVFHTETRLVPVDVVVTDKKGSYIKDLVQKDFKVWEDNKQQEILSFSFEADPASPNVSQKRYLVLFFDNSSMDFGEQARARDAAAKFIESNTGPNRLIAIINYVGSLQIAQNFTEDADRLRAAVTGIKNSAVTQASAGGFGGLGRAAGNFAAYSMILSLRELAKNLGDIPGRKILVLFTSGFPLTAERQSEVTATIDACNKSNVAIYPIDVRGLATMSPGAGSPSGPGMGRRPGGGASLHLPGSLGGPGLGLFSNSFAPQVGGGRGGGSTGGTGGRRRTR